MMDIPEFMDKPVRVVGPQDKDIICVDCGRRFPFVVGEQQFYWSKGLSEPKRCKACRVLRRRNTSLDMEVKDA